MECTRFRGDYHGKLSSSVLNSHSCIINYALPFGIGLLIGYHHRKAEPAINWIRIENGPIQKMAVLSRWSWFVCFAKWRVLLVFSIRKYAFIRDVNRFVNSSLGGAQGRKSKWWILLGERPLTAADRASIGCLTNIDGQCEAESKKEITINIKRPIYLKCYTIRDFRLRDIFSKTTKPREALPL